MRHIGERGGIPPRCARTGGSRNGRDARELPAIGEHLRERPDAAHIPAAYAVDDFQLSTILEQAFERGIASNDEAIAVEFRHGRVAAEPAYYISRIQVGARLYGYGTNTRGIRFAKNRHPRLGIARFGHLQVGSTGLNGSADEQNLRRGVVRPPCIVVAEAAAQAFVLPLIGGHAVGRMRACARGRIPRRIARHEVFRGSEPFLSFRFVNVLATRKLDAIPTASFASTRLDLVEASPRKVNLIANRQGAESNHAVKHARYVRLRRAVGIQRHLPSGKIERSNELGSAEHAFECGGSADIPILQLLDSQQRLATTEHKREIGNASHGGLPAGDTRHLQQERAPIEHLRKRVDVGQVPATETVDGVQTGTAIEEALER